MKPRFWKLSQGPGQFSYPEFLHSIDRKLAYIHKDSGAKGGSARTQADNFVDAPIGDYFYLTYGNEGIYLLSQFSGPVNLFSLYGEGWLDRPFRLIKISTNITPYDGERKWWTPNENSTFVQVPENEISIFEKYILIPYFEIKMSKYGL